MTLPRPAAVPRPVHDRRRHGVYLTPPDLVSLVLDLALPHVSPGPLTVIDPACGDGAFLDAAAIRLPRARLLGLELSPALAQAAGARVPRARVLVGDALRGGWEALERASHSGGTELWLGNPPYNGTSPLLGDPRTYRALCARLGLDAELPTGTSLRDDYAFFLLLAAERLRRRQGVLAWVTSATLLDAFLYAPLRQRLLDTLALEEVVDLGAGVFPGTRVRTCITVWRSPGPRRQARFRARLGSEPLRLGPVEHLLPEGPEWQLRPTAADARALDAAWRERGEPLDRLVPIHCTGLKTRFDELLVDVDPDRLLARVDAFLRSPPAGMSRFARTQGLADSLVPKLLALRRTRGLPTSAERSHLRPFFRYAGARHRGAVPDSARATCYLDRRLIPRGDHRLVGLFDPHAGAAKLVFNVRELPLSAALLEQEGCIPAHRHTRFAPLLVPERVRDAGPAIARTDVELGPLVPNLSAGGRAWAERVGGVDAAFRRVVAFVNGRQVQEIWAPAFGRSRTLPIPLHSDFESQHEGPRVTGKHLGGRHR